MGEQLLTDCNSVIKSVEMKENNKTKHCTVGKKDNIIICKATRCTEVEAHQSPPCFIKQKVERELSIEGNVA